MPRLSRRDIDEHVFDIEDPPEVIITCEECGGEGAIDEWESASKWSIDPPCARLRPCPACGGQGIFVDEAPGDEPAPAIERPNPGTVTREIGE